MKIRQAQSEEDYQVVEDFIANQVTPLPPVRLKNTFPQGYKSFLDQLSSDHETWILTGKDGVTASGSLVFQKMIIEGVEQTIALTNFMRVKPGAKSTLLWTKHLLPAFSQSIQKRNCKYIFSFVFYSFRSEIKKFRQAIKLRDDMPRYYLIRKANYTNIHGRIPWRSKALKSVNVRVAHTDDIPKILEFIKKQQIERKLIRPWDESHVEYLVRNGNQARNSFWIALDSEKEVVGCFLPNDITKYRKDTITEVTPDVQNYFYLQRLLSWFGFAAPAPKLGRPTPTLYLSHMEATNQDIFETLLRYAYKFLRRRKETLSYTHFAGNLITRPPSCFMSGALPMDFYLILPPTQDPPDFLKAYWMAPVPEFEAMYF